MSLQKARISLPWRTAAWAACVYLSAGVFLSAADVPTTLPGAVPATQPSVPTSPEFGPAAPPVFGPATQPAEPTPAETAASIKSWFADLANSDAAVRSDALTNLMGLSRDDLETLKAVVEESRPLAPAQASVLRQIVTQVYLAGEHYEGHQTLGFLGIKMEQTVVGFRDVLSGAGSLPSGGVVIIERMPGFPGARMLRDGDVILSILDHPNTPMSDPENFRTLVTSIGAGNIVHFQLLRQGQVIHVDVKLDPRPIEADQGFGITDLLERRRERADEFWNTHFAALVKEGVS
jgi:hypothetical protein